MGDIAVHACTHPFIWLSCKWLESCAVRCSGKACRHPATSAPRAAGSHSHWNSIVPDLNAPLHSWELISQNRTCTEQFLKTWTWEDSGKMEHVSLRTLVYVSKRGVVSHILSPKWWLHEFKISPFSIFKTKNFLGKSYYISNTSMHYKMDKFVHWTKSLWTLPITPVITMKLMRNSRSESVVAGVPSDCNCSIACSIFHTKYCLNIKWAFCFSWCFKCCCTA